MSLDLPSGFYIRNGKRLLDVSCAVFSLIVALPLMAMIALLVRLELGSPVLFRQQRPGLRGRPFIIHKFRTMTDARNAQKELLPDGERLTSLGRLLRANSLDELPGLLNVLKGEMSVVGPRPLRSEYLVRYTPEQMRRHEVKPGMTGWAQVNGRNAITWKQKLALDVWYVDHQSFLLDLRIMVLTISKTLRHEDINQPGQATAEEFTGDDDE